MRSGTEHRVHNGAARHIGYKRCGVIWYTGYGVYKSKMDTISQSCGGKPMSRLEAQRGGGES